MRRFPCWHYSGSCSFSIGQSDQEVPHNPPMQWTEAAGKILVNPESARRRLGH